MRFPTLRVLAVLSLVTLGACSSSAKDTTAPTEAVTEAAADTTAAAETTAVAETTAATETTAVAETTAAAAETGAASGSGDASSVAAVMAASFKSSTGVDLTEEQSKCMGDSILSTFTAKELIDLGQSKAGFDGLSDADKARAVGSFQKCPGLLEEALFAGFKSSIPNLDEAQGRCGATAIGKEFTAEEMVSLSSKPNAAQDPVVLTKIFKAFGNCKGLLDGLLATGMKQAGLTDTQAKCAVDVMLKELDAESLVKFSTDPSGVDPAVQTKVTAGITKCAA